MASSELLGALNRRREMAEAAGAVFEGSPRASAADTVWDKHHETQFTPKGKHRLPDESRMQRIEQAEEESAGTITPPEEHSPPPGKVRAKESPAEKAARRARVSDFGGPVATESLENDKAVEVLQEASPQEAKARSFAEPLLPPVQVQTEARSLPRVYAQSIDVSMVQEDAPSTPLEWLRQACRDKLQFQGEAWTNKPSLKLSAPSCTVTAICGYDHKWLEPDQCIVTNGTEFMEGPVADVCVLEARQPPEERLDCTGRGPFEENCIAFSPEGKINSEFAGSHLAKQRVMRNVAASVTTDDLTELVEFVAFTQPFVDKIDWRAITTKMQETLKTVKTPWPPGFGSPALCAEPQNTACEGIVANISFRATAVALKSQAKHVGWLEPLGTEAKNPISKQDKQTSRQDKRDIETALLMQALAHGEPGLQCEERWLRAVSCEISARASFDFSKNEVMDCPQEYPVEWYLSHGKSLARELGVPNDVDVSSVHIARAPAWFFLAIIPTGRQWGGWPAASDSCWGEAEETFNGKFDISGLVFSQEETERRLDAGHALRDSLQMSALLCLHRIKFNSGSVTIEDYASWFSR
ncbi:unnamed protein product [Symbiodinium sp. CCMP2592]|nr:unnamed protein product [Symbiodinium sp. CCMP2592]